jgi:hypothetical protein
MAMLIRTVTIDSKMIHIRRENKGTGFCRQKYYFIRIQRHPGLWQLKLNKLKLNNFRMYRVKDIAGRLSQYAYKQEVIFEPSQGLAIRLTFHGDIK